MSHPTTAPRTAALVARGAALLAPEPQGPTP